MRSTTAVIQNRLTSYSSSMVVLSRFLDRIEMGVVEWVQFEYLNTYLFFVIVRTHVN